MPIPSNLRPTPEGEETLRQWRRDQYHSWILNDLKATPAYADQLAGLFDLPHDVLTALWACTPPMDTDSYTYRLALHNVRYFHRIQPWKDI